jgi:membrane-associated phospholipid phosphatase
MAVRPTAIAPVTPGFPSGHATMSTLVYGGLALVHRRHVPSEGTVAAALAALVVLAVSLSRVVLGVHYLGDVLVGLLVGAVALAGFAAGRRYVVEGTMPW